MGSISRQSAVYFAGTILTAGAGYFFKIYVARTLGAEALGVYALGMTIVGFLGLFNALGLPTAAARFVAAYCATGELSRLGAFLRGSLLLLASCNFLLGAVLLVLGPWVGVHLYHLPALRSYLWAFALIMFLGVLNTFLGQVMAGYHDVARRTAITHFLGSPANVVFAVALISLGFGLTGYLVAQVGSALLVLVLLMRAAWKMTPPDARRVGSTRVERQVVMFSAAAFGTVALEFVLSQTDKIVLGYYLDARQVGIYAVAMALVGFVPIALQSVNQIFSPTIAELHASGNRVMLQQLYCTLTKWILILTIPLALTMIVFSRPLMEIFGPTFSSGATILALGTVGQLFNCAVGSVGYLLLMSGNQVQLIKVQGINAAVMLALSLILVPRMGATGAALATALTVITANASYLAAVRRRMKLFPYNASYFKLVLPTVCCAGTLLFLRNASSSMNMQWVVSILGLFSGYVLFLGVMWMLGLDRHDREIAHALWEKMSATLHRNEVTV